MAVKIILNKWQAFLLLVCLSIVVGLLWQSVWIFSRITVAKTIPLLYAPNEKRDSGLVHAVYIIGEREYSGYYFKRSFVSVDGRFPIRYLAFANGISRPDSFLGNWAFIFVFWGIIWLILLILFLRRDMISGMDKFIVQNQRPYLKRETSGW